MSQLIHSSGSRGVYLNSYSYNTIDGGVQFRFNFYSGLTATEANNQSLF